MSPPLVCKARLVRHISRPESGKQAQEKIVEDVGGGVVTPDIVEQQGQMRSHPYSAQRSNLGLIAKADTEGDFQFFLCELSTTTQRKGCLSTTVHPLFSEKQIAPRGVYV